METENFTYNDFCSYRTVSRETFDRLELYIQLLKKWQKTINLISASSFSHIWVRHIIDSIQLMDYIDNNKAIFDMGSGAGFPGLILAITGAKNVILIESDSRKAAFLQEAARVTKTEVNIINQRVEQVTIPDLVTLTARGFASLKDIFSLLDNKLRVGHSMLLLKGKQYQSEINDVQLQWNFDYEVHKSITDNEGVILSIQNPIKRSVI